MVGAFNESANRGAQGMARENMPRLAASRYIGSGRDGPEKMIPRFDSLKS